jgi:hypothetical protein
MKRALLVFSVLALVGGLASASTAGPATPRHRSPHFPAVHMQRPLKCQQDSMYCTEVYHSIGTDGTYTGHDEPSLLFYSKSAGSGNSNLYRLTLPRPPKLLPTQDGTGGTFDFQLHPAFWLGMALCDSQSDPNYTHICNPDTDANIFNNPNPSSPRYIGRHPGTAFLEMQFYPPGWAPFQSGGISCSARQWCAAMVIWSLSDNANTGAVNNNACRGLVGDESPNFAFITKSGVSQAPANAISFFTNPVVFTPDPAKDLFMQSGDNLTVSIHDTPRGLLTSINDLTSGQSGSMKASIANGFGQILFRPNASRCKARPYAYHPMYATTSPATRVPWAAHSYNVAFSDEIGHFEYCNFVDPSSGYCEASGANDPDGLDGDDAFCFDPSASTRVAIGGCTATDTDFDGTPYGRNWPGTFTSSARDRLYHPTAVTFTSPLFHGSAGWQNYSRAAFEADLPRIENFTTPPCQRHLVNPTDPHPGAGCVNPPRGSTFYPIYTTTNAGGSCAWQLGGPSIPGTTNTFGGSSATEYGTRASGNLLPLAYPSAGHQNAIIYEDFRHILPTNPCPASLP